ncbi:MAG: TetR/AcrR family transcriptional regulator [Verrucomicrobiae bacterium]|nr:TetR/AcrR family transcriptional regulator [Verrucomicrobiae bacterium]
MSRHLSVLAIQPDEAESPIRARIVQQARRHFLLHGFRGVSMDDLAVDLGISKKTLYAHFASKADLLKEAIRAKFGEVDADLERLVAVEGRSFPNQLQQLLECLERHLKEPQPSFIRDMQREPELFAWIQTLRRERIERYFGKLFAEGRRAELIREDVSAKLMIEILLGAIEAIINPQKLEELGLTPKTAFPMVVTVVLRGILTDHGRQQS